MLIAGNICRTAQKHMFMTEFMQSTSARVYELIYATHKKWETIDRITRYLPVPHYITYVSWNVRTLPHIS
jgi:hypothetical protein